MIDKRLWREAREARGYLALTIGLGLAGVMLAVLQAGYLARVVNGVFLEGLDLAGVRIWLWHMLGIILLRAPLAWGAEVAAHRAAAGIKIALRDRLMERLLALGPLYAVGERAGELVNVMGEGVEALEAYFSRYLPQLALTALSPLIILGFVFPVDLQTGLILVFTAPLIPVFMILIGKWAEALTLRQWDSLNRLSAHFLDVLQGLATLKIFGRSKDQIRVIARVSGQHREATLGVLRVAFLSALALELLATVSTALVAVTLGLRLVYYHIPFEQAFFLLLLAPEFYLPFRLLSGHYHTSLSGLKAAGRIFEIMDEPVAGRPGTAGRAVAPDCQGPGAPEITFADVCYDYGRGDRPALEGLSFKIPAGQRVALVGPSGAGKSTVAGLLLRFMEPGGGTIRVNGVPLGQIPPEQWRRQVALVPQNPYLFYGSVLDNIRLGRPGAAMDDVVEAARGAGAHDFISELPRGYHTLLGEGGYRLSGGQARRLAVARALLMDAPLLILDEATAGLDPENEEALQQALDRLMAGRTALVIAHRLATVYRADSILVLEAGRLAEAGGHRELMERRGLYSRLVAAYGGCR